MELYKKLAALRCFTHEDMLRLTGSENAAKWQIENYLRKGYIERIRRNLYAVVSLETGQPIPNRFQIATRASEDACVSHHSAFELYGYGNQVFYDVYLSTASRIRPFSYDGIQYHPVAWRSSVGITEAGSGVRVTSPERTVIDSIADFEKIGGLEELLRCLDLVPVLDAEGLLASLEAYHRSQLYQRVGYILEAFREELSLPESFFEECERNISSSRTYLLTKRDDFVLHRRWRLYAPKNLKAIIDKGVTDHDAF